MWRREALLALPAVALAIVLTANSGPRAQAPGESDLALIDAARRGDLRRVEELLAGGANVRAQGVNGITALIAASYRNHLDIARRLITAGADVNVQDDTRQSAYLIATSEGHVELLELTLAAGADVRRTDSYNGTGLIRAADRGHVEIVRRLIAASIDVDHVNRLGWTALLEAIILGDGGPRHTEIVGLLISAGANVNLADAQDVSPLVHAERRGFTEMVEKLRRAGAK